ncbi:hypothetical protein EMIHUDRAFT_225154 [Emiliania huxleyi CCMP1516]|uniref:GIY-YIG domain-containing protein n=2 Tax=Emiliania huxleyi TaxID=2903 RepID=A0A0D3KPC2_EMIH1|nr:hypothetical protein EMIHUDRAFT_225154 [Emiliania huxleyi CCMP1516]EOD37607.1 hypothetical protein EMIHUDRAFT_225154 [Emiliania huxleyi CCMP1516]|eukprot:XP_005790036.1 hypothetical protein EMIHUDRAFT_225154 [Emiliania huxleyi CCMP1516]
MLSPSLAPWQATTLAWAHAHGLAGRERINRTYVGASPDPVRRLRQHNGELSGGGAPAAGRPWRILLVVRGFSSKSDALAFEWAWQKPHTSRHIARQWGVKGFGKCGTRSKVSVRLAALALLLVHGHWAGGLRGSSLVRQAAGGALASAEAR